MHFMFVNSKVYTSDPFERLIDSIPIVASFFQIAIVDSKNLAKLGTMHLCAVNIWTW